MTINTSLFVGGSTDTPAKCSRAGCGLAARWSLSWRNPRIHAPERRKVWLACEDHVEFLTSYLRDRSFPLEVTEFSAPAIASGAATPPRGEDA